jgi:hypothetical protein
MTRIHRQSEYVHLQNLARKARRRGDAADALRWARLIGLHQASRARHDAAAERELERDAEYIRQEAELQKLEEARRRSGAASSHSSRPLATGHSC